jgi:hypothetical protein
MAGDWIKLDCTTPDKPEIVAMAAHLKIDQDAVVGKCVRLWIWANQQSVDGNALNVTDSFIDRLSYCPGFADALRAVGWLIGRDSRLSIPHFDRHNGQPAKTRALTKDRVGKTRNGSECNAASVTKPLPEKRREEKSKEAQQTQEPDGSVVSASKAFRPPTAADVAAFATKERLLVDGREFVDFYKSKGWRVGSSPMKDWQAAARNWHNRRIRDGDGSKQPTTRGATREAATADAFAVLSSAIACDTEGTDPAALQYEK